MQITRLSAPAQVLAFLDPPPAEAPGTLVFLLFFGSEAPETGESWCPDCVMADPVIRGTLARMAHMTGRPVHLVECPVGDRAAYKGRADHPFRRAPLIALQRIPTLIRWEDAREIGRLVESECLAPEALMRLAAPT